MSQVQIPNSDHCIWRAWINHLCKSGLDPIDCESSWTLTFWIILADWSPFVSSIKIIPRASIIQHFGKTSVPWGLIFCPLGENCPVAIRPRPCTWTFVSPNPKFPPRKRIHKIIGVYVSDRNKICSRIVCWCFARFNSISPCTRCGWILVAFPCLCKKCPSIDTMFHCIRIGQNKTKIHMCQLSSDWDWDLVPGTWDLGPGTWDLGLRT